MEIKKETHNNNLCCHTAFRQVIKPLVHYISVSRSDGDFKENPDTFFSLLLKEGSEFLADDNLYFRSVAVAPTHFYKANFPQRTRAEKSTVLHINDNDEAIKALRDKLAELHASAK